VSVKVIQDRLEQYGPRSRQEAENALKEITQEIALSGLARAGLFKKAALQGGTCLRIYYGLRRFSEDLDFALKAPDLDFDMKPYLASLRVELAAYGYQLEVSDRSTPGAAVKAAFLKDDSLGKLLLFRHRAAGTPRAVKIKLEVDANPPAGAVVEQKHLEFPVTVPVACHDLPSLFAGKAHALLCRSWEKGRDWYDFDWYVGRRAQINYALLSSALDQQGPWKGRGVRAGKRWFLRELRARIKSAGWEKHKRDIARFLRESDLDLIEPWSTKFFLERARVLEGYLE
jgi:hypothetical protein